MYLLLFQLFATTDLLPMNLDSFCLLLSWNVKHFTQTHTHILTHTHTLLLHTHTYTYRQTLTGTHTDYQKTDESR